MWKFLVEDEAFENSPFASALAALDIEKCYEKVALDLIWILGLVWNFPPRVLALALEAFAFERVIVLDGAVSQKSAPTNGLPSGSRFANRIKKWCSSSLATPLFAPSRSST